MYINNIYHNNIYPWCQSIGIWKKRKLKMPNHNNSTNFSWYIDLNFHLY